MALFVQLFAFLSSGKQVPKVTCGPFLASYEVPFPVPPGLALVDFVVVAYFVIFLGLISGILTYVDAPNQAMALGTGC